MPKQVFNLEQRVRCREACGFSISELLLSIAISGVTLLLGGNAISSIVTRSTTVNAQNNLRDELNRASEFIASEIRHANSIVRDPSLSAEIPSEFSPESNAGGTQVQPVLMLKAEDINSTSIVYYLASPHGDVWDGPKVLYRWGPDYDLDGTYQNINDPNQWTYEPLMDQVEDSATMPTCSVDWSGAGGPGFYACVHLSGKIAEIHTTVRVKKVLEKTDTYPHSFRASTRTQELPLGSSTVSSGSTSAPPPSRTGRTCLLLMDEDSLINPNNNPTEYGNPLISWNINRVGDIVSVSTGQVGDEGLFSLPSSLTGKNGSFPLADFLVGTVPQANLDEVQDVQPLNNTQINNLVGQSCLAIVYDSDISINYNPLQANLQGARFGKFYFTVLSTESGSELNQIRVQIDPVL